jgi:hypothetical protein
MNETRGRLIQLLQEAEGQAAYYDGDDAYGVAADYLLDNGVIVTPCVAMVEQFIKNGEFDKKLTAHNGKYAVVYMDKLKWNCPLIDITEQSYNTEKAEERIQALKARENEK